MTNARKARARRNRPEPPLPEAAVLRVREHGSAADVATYIAVRASCAAEMAAEMADEAAVEILGHDALPLAVHNAPRALAGKPRHTVLIIGTTEGGEWATWHTPTEPEPIPGSPAWHARQDQMTAARSASKARIHSGKAAGARLRECEEAAKPAAIQEMMRRFKDGCFTGTRCPHKRPDRAELTHQFGSQPDRRLCDRCAQPLLPYSPRACDLCSNASPAGTLTAVTAAAGHLLLHMALCDGCYPEGADAPRLDARPPEDTNPGQRRTA